MTVSVLHQKVSAIADDPASVAAGEVVPSDWNASHNITMDSGFLLGRSTAGAGSAEEITVGSGLSLLGGTLSASGTAGVSSFSAGTTGLTPSTATTGSVTLAGTLAVANGGTGVTTSTGTGSVVLSNSPALTTPNIGTPTAGTLTSCTGLPVSTGISGLGTGVSTALAVNTGSAGAFVVNGGALGTPSSGTVTNLTGTASININGTVGATTPASGAFTTLSASSTVSGTGFSTYLASPPAIGGTTPAAGSFTNLVSTGIATLGGASGSTLTGTEVSVVGTAPTDGGTGAQGIYTTILTPSNATNQGFGIRSGPGTVAASFTLSTLACFAASSGTIGAGSTVTTQAGFLAQASLTQASTNNYGFWGNIAASGTARFNLYMGGTAPNFLQGPLGIGSTTTIDQFRIGGTLTGGTIINSIILDSVIGSGVTSSYRGVLSRPITQAAAFTLSNLIHFYVNPQAKGAGSTITNQYGFFVESTTTDATSNFGFFSNIASASNRWNFYGNGTASNHFSGTVSVGSPATTHNLEVNKSITGGIERYQALMAGEIQSDVTNLSIGVLVSPSLNNSAFTLATYRGFQPSTASISGAATITTYHGFFHGAVTQSNITTTYGYTANIAASGTSRWNFYAGGTAPNYFAGNTFVGATTGDQALNVNGAVRVAATTSANQTSAGTMDFTSGALRFLSWGADASTQGTISWWTGAGALGATQRMTLTGANNLGLATATFGTSATNTFAVLNGTAPTTGPADTVQFYSTDLSAGNTIPSFYTEGTGIVGTGTPTANRTIAVRINGTVYYLLASTIP